MSATIKRGAEYRFDSICRRPALEDPFSIQIPTLHAPVYLADSDSVDGSTSTLRACHACTHTPRSRTYVVVIPGAGRFIQQEKADEVSKNRLLS
jgi:hypothetical protein